MSTQTRIFEDHEAKREKVPLLIGLYGPSGGGKTFSALRLATGIQQVFGGDIGGIDTESGRMNHYADFFKFRHLNFKAPFGSLDYLAAIRYFADKGVTTIIVDSLSHEHESEGGYLMTHAAELERMAPGDLQQQRKLTFAAWIRPARERRQLIDGILHLNINLISCFRAKEKLKIRPGKEPEELGWMPIAGEEFLFEQTANCLLPPSAKGNPDWAANRPGEIKMAKIPQQFIGKLNDGKQLSEEHGRILAEWAKGGAVTEDLEALTKAGDEASAKGTDALQTWWNALQNYQRVKLKAKLAGWKEVAAKAQPAGAAATGAAS